MEVDAVLAEAPLRFGERQVRFREKPDEFALQLGLRNAKRDAIDDGSERRAASPGLGRRCSQRSQIDEASELRLADGLLEAVLWPGAG